MVMAKHNFADILSNYLINTDPWYKKLFNVDYLAESLDNARKALQNVSKPMSR